MTGSATIDQLIINSPYEEPREHWRYHRETRLFTREPERRKAGYIRASESSRSFDDRHLHRTAARKPNSPTDQGLARGRLSRRNRNRTTTLGSRSLIPSGASSENSVLTASFALQMARC